MKGIEHFGSWLRRARRVLFPSLLLLTGVIIGRSTLPGRDATNEILDRNLPPDVPVWQVYDIDSIFTSYTGLTVGDLPAQTAVPARAGIYFPLADPLSVFESFQKDLCNAIKGSIDTDSWYDNGGTLGDCLPLGRRISIRHTPAVHAKVREFFAILERGPQRISAAAATTAPDNSIEASSDNALVFRIYDISSISGKIADQLIADWQSGPPPNDGGHLQGGYHPDEGRYVLLNHIQQDLVDWVEQTIDANSWKTNGGSRGEIRIFGQGIAVWQTAKVHASIQAMLMEFQREPRKLLKSSDAKDPK